MIIKKGALTVSISLACAWLHATSDAAVPAPVQGVPTAPPPRTAPPTARSVPSTEQRWIVQSILLDIADMAEFAAGAKDAPLPGDAISIGSETQDASGYHYSVTIHLPGQAQPMNRTLDLPGPVWDPAAFRPIAAAILDKLNLAGRTDHSKPYEDPVAVLVSPTTKALQQQNRAAAAFLADHPLAPEAHEQAAMIAGVLGMRENSGIFWDTRAVCNRAVAHLAFAAALRDHQPPSPAGEIAQLLVGLLDDTKKICEDETNHLQTEVHDNPRLQPWINVARLRNNRDWRILPDPRAASLVERLEYVRALDESISSDAAANALAHERDNVADWYCIILQGNFSVDAGHRFAAAGLNVELYETTLIFPELRQARPVASTVAAALNLEPGDAVQKTSAGAASMQPIDDGMWAHFFQRHLMNIALESDYFYRESWGVPDTAAQFETSIGKLFSQLTFYPLLQFAWSRMNNLPPDPGAADKLVTEHPEWITAAVWGEALQGIQHGGVRMVHWFSPGLPSGTAYCYYGRNEYIPEVKDLSLDGLARLYAIAPWHYGVAEAYLHAKYGDTPTQEQFRSILGPYLPFNTSAMRQYLVCIRGDVDQTIATYKHLADLEPYYYIQLSSYYRERGMNDAAAAAMQSAMDKGADSVGVANACDWTVEYYYTHGQKDKALAMANFAADVYSDKGLVTAAKLAEQMGDLQKAQTYYADIQDRYDDPTPLAVFHARHPDMKSGNQEAIMKDFPASTFPSGIKAVTLADFTAPPSKGVLINGTNDLLKQSGMKDGAIIVALNGKRTENFEQYSYLRDLTPSPDMEFIVYQDGKYQAIKANVPTHRFNLDFQSWQKTP